MAKLEESECKGCSGIMNVENKAKHNQLSALVVIGIAIALVCANIGLIIGIALGLHGLYMVAATKNKCL